MTDELVINMNIDKCLYLTTIDLDKYCGAHPDNILPIYK